GRRPSQPDRRLADDQRAAPEGHAHHARALDPVRRMAVGGLARVRPGLAVSATAMNTEIGSAPLSTALVAPVGHLAGQVVIPSLTAYALFLAALWVGSRTPTPRTRAVDPPASIADWGRLVRFLAATAVGGFVVFVALVLFFYFA